MTAFGFLIIECKRADLTIMPKVPRKCNQYTSETVRLPSQPIYTLLCGHQIPVGATESFSSQDHGSYCSLYVKVELGMNVHSEHNHWLSVYHAIINCRLHQTLDSCPRHHIQHGSPMPIIHDTLALRLRYNSPKVAQVYMLHRQAAYVDLDLGISALRSSKVSNTRCRHLL